MRVFLHFSWYSIQVNIILCNNGKCFKGKMASNKYTFKVILFEHFQTEIVAGWEITIIWNEQAKRRNFLCEEMHTISNQHKLVQVFLFLFLSKEHNIWSCIGTEAFWQSGGKESLKVLLTLDMACLIGDISPTSDVTKVAGFCNSLLMISSTSSEKQSETDLLISLVSTILLL